MSRDCAANEAVGSIVLRRAGGWRVGLVRVRAGRRLRPQGPGGAGPGNGLALVPRRSMESGLGQHRGLGLESLPRVARSRRSVRSGGLGTVGAPAAVGAAAATPTAVGTRGQPDVEPHCQ
jgi:hypothetical protein